MKGKKLLLIQILILLTLSGCSAKDGIYAKLQGEMLKKSNLESNDSYSDYLRFKDSEQIDEQGHYIMPEEETMKGSIHITFFDNNLLSTAYYYDKEMTAPIDTDNCYINPGDSIYADIPQSLNVKNDFVN